MRTFVYSLLLLIGACAQQPAPDPEDAPVPIAEGWSRMEPGGETSCSDGSPYAFYVRPGAADKLMVYFEGGGACWFRRNCDPSLQPSYKINLSGQNLDNAKGIFDFSRTDNPFLDHTVVYAPYCTGDVHLGRLDRAYPPEEGQQPEQQTGKQGELTIRHRGMTNVDAVLEWTYANITKPRSILVTGSSAGSIPSPYYALLIAEHYKDARVVQLGDGSGGYRRREGGSLPHAQWGTMGQITKVPAYADMDDASFGYDRLYSGAAKVRPDIQFAAYDAAEDAVQKQFLALSGIKGVSLLEMITANQNDIRSVDPDFRSFIAGGDSHTVLMRPEFYTFKVGNTAIRDWVADLAAGKAVEDARCNECGYAELAGAPMPAAMAPVWTEWESEKQIIEPFWIFDNVAYVGIDWVAAYVIRTSEGLILIDSLYGKWIPQLERNLRTLGLDPRDVKYVLTTHGHFDHAGGAAYFQKRYGARVVMSDEDWALAAEAPELPYFAFDLPAKDIVAADGHSITLGDTEVTAVATAGHTPGSLSYRYPAKDGATSHGAITLGGVGLNFDGVERTEMYIASYERLASNAAGIAVSLPNHAAMGRVFERRDALATRAALAPHPFVDAEGYQADLQRFIAAAKDKLAKEKTGTAEDSLTTLSKTLAR
jgi:glyoxylase-like metal-dependent hydrolase (beta-lactamase superfamily II)